MTSEIKLITAILIGAVLAVIIFLVGGCATSGPRNESEAFPLRNQDPTLGLMINEGMAHLNVYLYDESGRLVEQMYLTGVNRHLTINGQSFPEIFVRRLEVGQYRVEVWPFYYQNQIFPPERIRVDLQKQTQYLYVNRDPTDTYFYGRHWAWLLRLNGGNIPDTAHGLPGIKLNIKTWGGPWGGNNYRYRRGPHENYEPDSPACRYAKMCD